MRDPAHDILFESVAIGPKTLPNRFVRAPLSGSLSQCGRCALGGWGTVFAGEVFISDGQWAPTPYLSLTQEPHVEALQATVEEVHSHGALAGIELGYNPNLIEPPVFMELHQRAITESLRLGFDLISVYSAHGGGILTKLLQGVDKMWGFGWAVEHARTLLTMCQNLAGMQAAIGVRFGVDPPHAGAFINALDDLVDYWDITTGIYYTRDAFDWLRPSPSWPSRQIKRPLINVGQFVDADTMSLRVRDGTCDLIGAARPSLADPDLPNKIRDGLYHEIAACNACNDCARSYERGAPVICTQWP